MRMKISLAIYMIASLLTAECPTNRENEIMEKFRILDMHMGFVQKPKHWLLILTGGTYQKKPCIQNINKTRVSKKFRQPLLIRSPAI